MEERVYVGIDNGVSGSIAMIGHGMVTFLPVPAFKEQDYTKSKNNISRIDHNAVYSILEPMSGFDSVLVLIERPMVNPTRFQASASALRALESVLIAVKERLGMPHRFVDSKLWQKKILPEGIVGSAELKKASKDMGIRLFPKLKYEIERHKDADSLLMAEVARREQW